MHCPTHLGRTELPSPFLPQISPHEQRYLIFSQPILDHQAWNFPAIIIPTAHLGTNLHMSHPLWRCLAKLLAFWRRNRHTYGQVLPNCYYDTGLWLLPWEHWRLRPEIETPSICETDPMVDSCCRRHTPFLPSTIGLNMVICQSRRRRNTTWWQLADLAMASA